MEERVADLFHTLFKASTHHGKIDDPLAQAEDEPRRHKACRALRKWLGWQLHQPPPPSCPQKQTQTTEVARKPSRELGAALPELVRFGKDKNSFK